MYFCTSNTQTGTPAPIPRDNGQKLHGNTAFTKIRSADQTIDQNASLLRLIQFDGFAEDLRHLLFIASIDLETHRTESFDHFIVARELKERRDHHSGWMRRRKRNSTYVQRTANDTAQQWDLISSDLTPTGIVADDRDDRNLAEKIVIEHSSSGDERLLDRLCVERTYRIP